MTRTLASLPALFVSLLAITLTVPAPAWAQTGSISQSNVTYAITLVPDRVDSPGGLIDFTANRATVADIGYQSWWYYRIAGVDTRENAFNSGNGQLSATYSGNTATFRWVNVDNKNIAAVYTVQVYSTGPSAGVAAQRLAITNNTGAPIQINVYAYADVDLCGANNDAIADGGDPFRQRVIGPCPSEAVEWFALGADHYQSAPFAAVRALLLDAVPTDLNDTGIPRCCSDWTDAYQWQNRAIGPGATEVFAASLAHNVRVGAGRANAQEYGIGKPGTNGLAAWGLDLPYLGGTTPLTIRNGLPAAQPLVLLSSVSASVSIPPYGHLNVGPSPLIALMAAAFDGSGISMTPFPIPNSSALIGAMAFLQAFYPDPGAAQAPVAHTRGLQWTLGSL